ncbi:MAG TPA: alpha-ketoacid dehydrogenase subunit beta, partial [Streptosporangiaceae bacterium]|nr:alpha-ketoacid dehydrogenase subunit beta [Streptosporangiaceae bacterium]
MTANERVAENLNAGLHKVFASDADVYLLGEDVLDPYGGAFKVTRGLSSRYPDRIITTPISESGIVGVANGLALCGDKVVVEV